MLISDKRALVPLFLEESALVPKERIVPSRMVLEKCDDDGNRCVKARLTARGDQDPQLLSLVRNQLTSAPTVSTDGKVVALQVIASSGADVELGDVTGAFLESAELRRQGGKLFFLRRPPGGLLGLHPQQLLEIRLPSYGLNDSLKRWFLEVSTFLRHLRWKPSVLDECVLLFFMIQTPGLWQGYFVCTQMTRCWVAVAQPTVKQWVLSVLVSRSAKFCGASFPRTSSPRRSLCLRVLMR